MKVKSESEVAQLCPTLATPWTAVHQAPPSMGFSRQEYWSRVPLASPSLAVREMQTKNIVIYQEKAIATHSSTLAWKILWTEEPGGLQSMGLLRVRHD